MMDQVPIEIDIKEDNKEETALGGIAALVSRHLRVYFEAHQDHLPPEGLYHRIWEEVEMSLFYETLRLVDGNQIKAAEILGIHRNTLRRKLNRKPL